MKVLVINCGSSSLKYQLIDMADETVLAKGLCERIGINGSRMKLEYNGKKVVIDQELPTHDEAVNLVLNTLTDKEHNIIADVNEIGAVGHRIVHGGEYFTNSVEITDEVIAKITECCDLAPLHNPAHLKGIDACKKLMPGTKMVAVFDTSFHQTMPEQEYIYGIPYELYKKYKVRRYGFHGTSHKYVSHRLAEMLEKPVENLKIVSCHLGQGASICAVKEGQSVATTMGFTPLAGLVMGTRSGDIDPAIIKFVMEKENMTIDQIDEMLNKKSGILGISEISGDFRDIEDKTLEGDKDAKRAQDIFCYKVAKCVGEYMIAMNGIDAVIFTAGVGENSDIIRKQICDQLGALGTKIDEERNKCRGEEREISTSDSKVKVFIVPTNEELMIARDTKNLV